VVDPNNVPLVVAGGGGGAGRTWPGQDGLTGPDFGSGLTTCGAGAGGTDGNGGGFLIERYRLTPSETKCDILARVLGSSESASGAQLVPESSGSRAGRSTQCRGEVVRFPA
jgi:hypothetical protein